MPVEDEIDPVALQPALDVVGHAPHGRQVVRFEKPNSVLHRETLASQRLLPYGDQGRILESYAFDYLHAAFLKPSLSKDWNRAGEAASKAVSSHARGQTDTCFQHGILG